MLTTTLVRRGISIAFLYFPDFFTPDHFLLYLSLIVDMVFVIRRSGRRGPAVRAYFLSPFLSPPSPPPGVQLEVGHGEGASFSHNAALRIILRFPHVFLHIIKASTIARPSRETPGAPCRSSCRRHPRPDGGHDIAALDMQLGFLAVAFIK
jgi:hypothetical protein